MSNPDAMSALDRVIGTTRRSTVRLARLMIAAAIASGSSGIAGAQAAPTGFVDVRPEQIQWRPHPVVAGGHIAVLLGDPAGEGPYAVRMRFPPNSRVQPHTHPEDRSYTVLAGEWKLGFGERFDEGALRSYSAGSLYRLPRGVAHFQATGSGETIIQIQGRGPSATNFLRPPGGQDD